MLPAFLEFARGAVLVAHNAPFDLGFLKAACARDRHRLAGRPPSVDTAVLARRLLTRDEVPNCKLATLAPFFRATTTPTHRALDDARATVDVLHGLFERLGPLGVTTLEELTGAHPAGRPRAAPQAAPGRRRPARAGRLPLPRPARRAALRRHVATTCAAGCAATSPPASSAAGSPRWSALAQRVDAIPCAHALEAAVRELRLIAEHKPRVQPPLPVPRAGAVGAADRGAVPPAVRGPAGPPGHRASSSARSPTAAAADAAVAAVHEALPAAAVHRPALARACRGTRLRAGRHGPLRRAVHRRAVGRRVRRASPRCSGPPSTATRRPLVAPLLARVDRLAAEERYEDAAVLRDRVAVLVRAVRRRQRLESLAAVPELVARPAGRRRRLAPVRRPPRPAGRRRAAPRAARRCARTLAGLLPTAETPTGPDDELAASVDETELILRWMEKPGTRLVELDRHPGQPRARHRRVQRLPRPGRGRPRRPRPVRRRAVRWAPGPGPSG